MSCIPLCENTGQERFNQSCNDLQLAEANLQGASQGTCEGWQDPPFQVLKQAATVLTNRTGPCEQSHTSDRPVLFIQASAGSMKVLPASDLPVSTGNRILVQLTHLRHSRVHTCRWSRGREPLQRAMVVRCFKHEEVRTPWHTLPLKHVLESQQFDQV